jgi:acetyl-CoA C-acetyltransferase
MKKGDDVVVVSMARTPTALFGGALKNVIARDLAIIVIKEVLNRSGINKEEVGDVIFGQLYFRSLDEPNVARIAGYMAGLPKEVPGMTIQRACASGLQAIITGMQEIKSGQCEIVIAGGVESMSNAPYESYTYRWGQRLRDGYMIDSMYSAILSCPPTGTGMGMTAENLADKFDIKREEMDEFAFMSHQLATKAVNEGKFKEEIVPVPIPQPKGEPKLFDKDEGPRPDTSIERLAKLKPVFKKDGKITAGNSCTLNDGAAVIILMTRNKAESYGLKPLAKIVSFGIVGVDPDIMGHGPVPAAFQAMERANLKTSDIDIFHVNEAFAAVAVNFQKHLGLSRDVLNVNGGAIALGHAIGATGCRYLIDVISEINRRNAKRGLFGLCQGTGMGTVIIVERDE